MQPKYIPCLDPGIATAFAAGIYSKLWLKMRALDGRVDFSRLLTTFGDFHEFSECDQVTIRNVSLAHMVVRREECGHDSGTIRGRLGDD